MVHNKLKSDDNYLTGAIPSEVQALSAFTGPNKGEFMLKLSSTVKIYVHCFSNTHTFEYLIFE